MRGLGLGLSLSGRGAGSAFSPTSLAPAAWWDAADNSTVFQDTAGSTPAANSSPIGRISDKSGNSRNLLQATAGSRPTRLATGADFDGVDDGLATASGITWPASSDVWFVIHPDSVVSFVTAWDATNVAAEFLGVCMAGDGNISYAGVGTPEIYVNGSAIGGLRSQLATALGTSAPKVLEYRAAAAAFSSFAVGNYSSFVFNGRLAEILVIDSSTMDATKRSSLLSYLTAKWGAS